MTDTSRETFTDTLVVASIESDEAAPLLAELEYECEYATRYEDYDGFDKDEDAPEEIDLFLLSSSLSLSEACCLSDATVAPLPVAPSCTSTRRPPRSSACGPRRPTVGRGCRAG